MGIGINTDAPTPEPTKSPITKRPTDEPTTSNPTTSNPTTSNPTTSRPTTSNPTTANPTTSEPTKRPTDKHHSECPVAGIQSIGDHCSFEGRCEYDFVECCGERGASTVCTCEDGTVVCMAIDRCMAPCPTPRPTTTAECLPKTVYLSGLHEAMIPVQNSDPLFHHEMNDTMTFSMDVSINSIP